MLTIWIDVTGKAGVAQTLFVKAQHIVDSLVAQHIVDNEKWSSALKGPKLRFGP